MSSLKGGENIVKKVFFISILILFLAINIVSAEDVNNTAADVSYSSQTGNEVLHNIEIEYVQLNTSDVSVFLKVNLIMLHLFMMMELQFLIKQSSLILMELNTIK